MIFPRPRHPGQAHHTSAPGPDATTWCAVGAGRDREVARRRALRGRRRVPSAPPGSGGGVEVHLVVLDVDVGVVVVERVLVERVLEVDVGLGLGLGVVEGVVDLHVGVVVVERVVDVDVRGLVEADVPDLGVACRVVLADGDVLGVLDVGDRLADDDVVHVGAVVGGAVVGRAVVGRAVVDGVPLPDGVAVAAHVGRVVVVRVLDVDVHVVVLGRRHVRDVVAAGHAATRGDRGVVAPNRVGVAAGPDAVRGIDVDVGVVVVLHVAVVDDRDVVAVTAVVVLVLAVVVLVVVVLVVVVLVVVLVVVVLVAVLVRLVVPALVLVLVLVLVVPAVVAAGRGGEVGDHGHEPMDVVRGAVRQARVGERLLGVHV